MHTHVHADDYMPRTCTCMYNVESAYKDVEYTTIRKEETKYNIHNVDDFARQEAD